MLIPISKCQIYNNKKQKSEMIIHPSRIFSSAYLQLVDLYDGLTAHKTCAICSTYNKVTSYKNNYKT